MPNYDHGEADTKLPLLASVANNNVVAVATDCDILVLLISFYATKEPSFQWFMKYETNKFAVIYDICQKLGPSVSKLLPQFHSITGSDTTSFFFSKGKLKPFKRVLQLGSISLLECLGLTENIEEKVINDSMEFIRTVVFNGEPDETYLDTRLNSFQDQPKESKTTRTILPDFDSIKQHILRVHHRSFIWKHSDEFMIPNIAAIANGWWGDGKSLYPIWFTGSQYPPPEKKTKKKRNDGYAGDEDDVIETSSSKNKRPKKKTSDGRGRKFRRMANEIADNVDDEIFVPSVICPVAMEVVQLRTEDTVNFHSSDETCDPTSGEEGEDEMEKENETAIDSESEWEKLSEFGDDEYSDSADSD